MSLVGMRREIGPILFLVLILRRFHVTDWWHLVVYTGAVEVWRARDLHTREA